MPTPSLDAPFERFLATLEKATNETAKREAFIVLAATGFEDSQLSTDLALGAEYRVNFEKKGLLRRGAIDCLYGNLVIEFENDLNKTGDHALEQLRGYCAGAWTEERSTTRPYLAIATDGERWEVYSARTASENTPVDDASVELILIESWKAENGASDPEELRVFLNRLFFRTVLIAPNARNFASDFGLRSPAFLRSAEVFKRKLAELHGDPQLGVLEDAWKLSLETAYGSIETSSNLLVQHTYLATLARLLVWAALERRPLRRSELAGILQGVYFEGKMIANMVEDDFFRWHSIPSESDTSTIFVALANQLSGYDLTVVKEDILKPLYEQLVDPATRHALGEFYTPDWLAERVTAHLFTGVEWEAGAPRVLDPACGSGTFLRTVIHAMRSSLAVPASQHLGIVLSSVMGIDVHPLAVIVSKATYLLAIRDLLSGASEPVTLPVFLANALTIPQVARQTGLFNEDVIALRIDGRDYEVPAEFINNGSLYDEAIEEVISVARAYGKAGSNLEDAPRSLVASLGDRLRQVDKLNLLPNILGQMARHIAELIRARRDSVHGFLLKNHYRPAMLRGTFDLIVGNPPWLTVGSVRVPAYRDDVLTRAKRSGIASRSIGEQSHTELATLFLVAAVEDYLQKDDSDRMRVGFIMPRSLFTAKHHRVLREGGYNAALDVVELWDLDGVSPLFNVPSCVLFAATVLPRPDRLKKARKLAGRLPDKDAPPEIARGRITDVECVAELRYLGNLSAWVLSDAGGHDAASDVGVGGGRRIRQKAKSQPYLKRFRQGAVIYPQMLLVVTGDEPLDRNRRRSLVHTDESVVEGARSTTELVNHIVETVNLFATVPASLVVPFGISGPPWTVVLPVLGDPGSGAFKPVSADSLRADGRVKTAEWLDWAETQWVRVRKPGVKSSLSDRLDYVRQLSAQDSRAGYVVIYAAAAKRPVAAMVPTDEFALPFVARDRTYHSSFDTREEACYMVAMLNSDYVAGRIAQWINRGLFGPRDINKRVLEVPWPLYDATDTDHQRIALVCSELIAATRKLLASAPAHDVGLVRRWVRTRLESDLRDELESLVERVSERSPA